MKLSCFVCIGFIAALPVIGRGEDEYPKPATTIASVGEIKITAESQADLGGVILGVLLETYAKEHAIDVSDGEIEKFLARMREGQGREKSRLESHRSELSRQLAAGDVPEEDKAKLAAEIASIDDILKNSFKTDEELGEQERKQLKDARWALARATIRSWKINKALYDRYGGRVIYQQGGPEPLDAYRKFLEEKQKAGAFSLSEASYEADLWRIFKDDQRHDFVPDPDSKRVMGTPPWERKDED